MASIFRRLTFKELLNFSLPGTATRAEPTFFDTADVSVRGIEVDAVADGSDLLINARYHIQENRRGDRRPIAIDFSTCPLWPLSIEGSASASVTFTADENPPKCSLQLQEGAESWGGSEVTIKLRWNEAPAHPPFIDKTYLHLPWSLPDIGRGPTERAIPSHQPTLQVGHGLRDLLVGAVAYTDRGELHDDEPLLYAVLARTPITRIADVQGRAQLSLLGESDVDISSEDCDRIVKTIRDVSDFCAEQLGVAPALRLAVMLNSTPKTGRIAGPLLTERLGHYPLSTSEYSLDRLPPPGVVSAVASNWWGVACRCEGPGGLYLNGGIAYAVGLAWAESHQTTLNFQALLSYYSERTTRASRLRRVPYRSGERTIIIGLVLFYALSKRPELWRMLRELTTEYWGRYAPERDVLRRLEEAGVRTKDFVGLRFTRTDQPSEAR